MTATGTPPKEPTTSVPAWPTAVASGQPGMSSYGISTAFSSASANAPSPLPSTTPTAGEASVLGSDGRDGSVELVLHGPTLHSFAVTWRWFVVAGLGGARRR